MSNEGENGVKNGTANCAVSEIFNEIGDSQYINHKHLPHTSKKLDQNQKIYPDVLETIGVTPLVKLSKIPKSGGIQCDMYAKCEFFNPGGSVKDRIAYRMILDAEKHGILVSGKSVLIEPTSGNTGIGLALAATIRGYRCIIVLPEKMSDEKVNTLLALGAEIIRTPTEAASDDPESNLMVARRLAKEIPNAVLLDQYNNPYNPLAHYEGTAEEILWAMDDDIDMVVVGAGTGGTITGISRKLKERCPKCVVVGVDPYGSILAQPEEKNKTDVTYYEVEGIGYDFIPKSLDRYLVDDWIKTYDKDGLVMSKRLIREEGLLCGGSSGSVMWAAMQAAATLKAGKRCVVVLPDGIRNYMTKFVVDPWMEARYLQPVIKNEQIRWWNTLVSDDIGLPVVSIPDNTLPLDALKILKKAQVPALTIVNDKGSLVGVFTADFARKRLVNLGGTTEAELKKFFEKKFYSVDLVKQPTLGLVSRILDIAPFVVVVKTDLSKVQKPIAIINSEALLDYTTAEKEPTNGL